MPYLTVLSGPARGKTLALNHLPVRTGRDPEIELSLNDSKASRIHAEFTLKDGQCILRDLRSKNGTLVNGTAISALLLKEGDQIQIGETRIGFSLQDDPHISPEQALRKNTSSASRIPLGVDGVGEFPTLDATGTEHGHGAKFETMELNAPLAILRGEILRDDPKAQADAVGLTPAAGSDAEALSRANRHLRALFAIARAAAETTSSLGLWSALTEGLSTALEADRLTPVTRDEKGHWDVLETTEKNSTSVKNPFKRIPVSRTIVDYALRTRRSVLTAPRSDSRFEHSKSIGEQGISSAISVPIIWQDEILGLIYADRLGGVDFVRDDLELVTAACLQAAPALTTLLRLEEALQKKERLVKELKSQNHILGESARMCEVAAFIERAAPTNSVVLVLGESGTGKELVARATHYNSLRNDAPFIVVNCAALTETLIESELFGHVRGAFTGATSDRAGRFEMAHEGTIFLDEIGELSNSCQTKLLRVLEQGEISRVGEGRVRKVDVRIVAATNRDLLTEVKAGRFREDLFYRLNVLSINLPPLRERGRDALILIDHYLRQAAARSGRHRLEFSEESREILLRYRWPGNVRELRNLTERIAVLCPHEVIGVADLPAEVRLAMGIAPTAGQPVATENSAKQTAENTPTQLATPPLSVAVAATPSVASPLGKLADIEKEHILRVLAACDSNKKLTAEKLGIDRSTLYTKLRAYGILSQD